MPGNRTFQIELRNLDFGPVFDGNFMRGQRHALQSSWISRVHPSTFIPPQYYEHPANAYQYAYEGFLHTCISVVFKDGSGEELINSNSYPPFFPYSPGAAYRASLSLNSGRTIQDIERVHLEVKTKPFLVVGNSATIYDDVVITSYDLPGDNIGLFPSSGADAVILLSLSNRWELPTDEPDGMDEDPSENLMDMELLTSEYQLQAGGWRTAPSIRRWRSTLTQNPWVLRHLQRVDSNNSSSSGDTEIYDADWEKQNSQENPHGYRRVPGR